MVGAANKADTETMLQPERGAAPTPEVQPRRLRRADECRIGGVAEGIGRYLQVPPLLIRLAFFVATLLGGAGIALYAGAWLLIPGQNHPDPRPLTLTSNPLALVAGFLALLVGAFSISDNAAWSLGSEIIIPIGIVLAGVWILNQRSAKPTASLPPPPATRGRGAWPPPEPHAAPYGQPLPPTGAVSIDAQESSPWDKPASEKPDWDDAAWENTPWENSAWENTAGTSRNTADHSVESVDNTAVDNTAVDNTAVDNTAPDNPAVGMPGLHGAATDFGGPAVGRVEPWAMARTDPSSVPETDPGPPITSITLAAAASVSGFFLVLANVAGIAISSGVILGAILAVIGAGLVASALLGRALGLYPLAGLVLVLLAASPLIDATLSGGVGTRSVRVTSVDALEPSYSVGLGQLTLDVTRLEPSSDTTIEVDVGAGYAEIIVPADGRVEVNATSTAGYVEAFNLSDEGLFNDLYQSNEPAASTGPTLTIDANVTFGYIEVRRGL